MVVLVQYVTLIAAGEKQMVHSELDTKVDLCYAPSMG